MKEKRGNVLCHRGNNEGQRGVGFIIKKEYSRYIREFKGISDRMAYMKLKIENKELTIVES